MEDDTITTEEIAIAERVLLDILIEQADTETERQGWERERARRLALLNRSCRQGWLFL
jgi:hypothetical protein